jgi:lysophospholipase L1-like esterase
MGKSSVATRSSFTWSLILALYIAAPVRAETGQRWVGSWYASPTKFAVSFSNATLRTVVHLTAGGDRLRVRLSNLYGHTPLKVGAARVAANAASKEVRFNGQRQVLVPPGSTVISDPVDFKTSAETELAVSVFYPESIPQDITLNYHNGESNLLSPGNTVLDAQSPPTAKPLLATYFLAGVDIEGAVARSTIVVLGDSMSDGGSQRWPALLAHRLHENGKYYGVLNASIGGNRLLRDTEDSTYGGESALKRFDGEVLDQPGVRYVIVYEGINDLASEDGVHPPSSAAEITGAMRRLAGRAHDRGLKIYVATLVQIEGRPPDYFSPAKDAVRKEVNAWIRTTKDIDAYFDFDHALADPAQPNRMSTAFHDGDYHPNNAGQKALSEVIDLSVFE